MFKKIGITAIISIVCYFSVSGQNNSGLSVTKAGLFTIISCNMSMTIDGHTGSRVLSLKLNDDEILGSKNEHPRYYGSTLWLSPEDKWNEQGLLDTAEYLKEFFNGAELHLRSKIDTVLGFEMLKVFQANIADTSIIIKYTITNISKVPQEVAPWEVTRVPTGGLAFFPKGSGGDIPVANKILPLLAVCDSAGIIWYPYDSSLSFSRKLFMDGGEGWVAYVHNRVLFIKKFPSINPAQAAPGEKNIELYVNKENTYIELENQGVYQKLLAGSSLLYEVKWYARRLPSGLKAEIGNEALISYIRNVVSRNTKLNLKYY